MKKRVLSILLAIVLLATAVPLSSLSVSAEELVPLTVAQAVELGTAQGNYNETEEYYYVQGTLTDVYNSNLYVSDAYGNTLLAYSVYDQDNQIAFADMENPPAIGNTVLLYGQLGYMSPRAVMWSGRLIECVHQYDAECDPACNLCGKVRETEHTLETVTTPATLTEDGSIISLCTVCGTEVDNAVISHPATIKLSKTSYTYNGKVQTPSVSVLSAEGIALKKDTDYTVKYASGRKNAGTYKVTVTFKGNYTGTKTLSYKIKTLTASKVTVKASKTVFAYNGKTQTPTITLKDSNGKTLKNKTDYTVKLPSGRKKVGTYKVTITLKGNYSGKKTVSYTIAPTTKTKATVVKGATYKLGAKSNTSIKYSSSNKKVAKVSSKGVVTAIKAGTATITVKSGSVTRKVKITVKNPGVSITASKKSVYRGKKLQLKATTYPSGAKVTWSVNKKKIATVSKSGVVTGKKYGVVTVTAKITYKGKTYKDTYKVQVKVESPNVSVFISSKSDYTDLYAVSLTNNGTKKLKVTGKAWVYAGGESAYSTGQMYVDDTFCTSFTMGQGSVTYVYTLEENLLFLSSYRVACYIYFEYDGETYVAKCDSSIYGLNRCTSVSRVS